VTAPPAKSKQAKRRTQARSARLFRYDRAQDGLIVGGADEAGRGCLAGPLVAAGVAFNPHALGRRELRALDDSKRLSAAAREDLAGAIIIHAERVVVRSVCAPTIDRGGLHRANLRLLAECLAGLADLADVTLSDGFRLPAPAPADHRAVIGGDGTSAAIAAASVIAKTVRDRMMTGPAASTWPEFGFGSHVGYGTPFHQQALRTHGLTPIHRRSFQSTAYPDEATMRLFEDPEG
jgi:ribonuclease HII